MGDPRETAYAAIQHHERGELPQAEALYRRYLSDSGPDPAIEHLLGMLRLQRGDPEEAQTLVAGAVQGAPDDAEYRGHLALILDARGDSAGALTHYRRAAVLTPGDAALLLRAGRAARKAGMTAEAIDYLRQALALDDGHEVAMELAAALEADGQRGTACELLEQFCARHPDDAIASQVLGALALRHGHRARARQALSHAVELDPGSAIAHNDLGALHYREGNGEAAIQSLNRALALDPGYTDAHYNLGTVLEKLGRYPEATGHYLQAIALDPDHHAAYRNLATIYYKTGRLEDMAGILERHLERQPDDARVRHMLAAARGDRLDTSEPRFVRELFDDFATDYDERLAGIEYRGPALIHALLEQLDNLPRGRVLDAGCGTGLCGPVLRPHAETLVGVDLSAGMLDRARRRREYDELVHDELVAYLQATTEPFTLISAADTLIYVGDLGPALAAAANTLCPGGRLVFTVEALGDGDSFALGPSGRFQHSASYLRRALAHAGFAVEAFEPVQLRLELGKPVESYLVAARSTLPS